MSVRNKEKVKEFNQNLYILALCVLAFKSYMIDTSKYFQLPAMIDTIIIAIFLGCLIWKLMTQKFTAWQIILLCIMGFICLLTCIKAVYGYVIFSFFGIAAIQDVKLKEVLKKTCKVKMSIILIHVIIYFVYLSLWPYKINYSYRSDGVPRHNFFMGHANTFSGYILWTSLEYIYAHYDKITKIHLAVIWFLNLVTYIYTDSNTSFLIITIMIVLIWMDKCAIRFLDKAVAVISKYLFLILSVLCILACITYTHLSGVTLRIFDAMNKFFTGRLLYGAYAYDTQGITLFGRQLAFPEKVHWRVYWFDKIIFDNAYIQLLVLAGAIYLLILSIFFIWLGNKTNHLERIMILAYCIYGITEAYIINAGNCFPLLLVGVYFYRSNVATHKLGSRQKKIEKRLLRKNRGKKHEESSEIKYCNTCV